MKDLNIGFDGKRAVFNNTGLGNYSRLAVKVIADSLPSSTLKLYIPRDGQNPRLSPLLSLPNVTTVLPDKKVWRSAGSIWRVYKGLTDQIRRDRIDLYHGLSNELPLDIHRSGIPSVVTIHDLIFRRLPHTYKPVDRAIYDYKFNQACLNADRIIAISDCTRRDIVELYGINPDKIDVVYQGCAAQFKLPVPEHTREAVRHEYALPERYIISVGTIEERKNQLLAVRALKNLPEDVHLILIGGHRTDYYTHLLREVNRLGLSRRVKILSNVPFDRLPALYAMASVASYTSRYEGFGIPVIEALASGTPVIAATGSCLEEAGGPGALYIGPDSVNDYVDAASHLLQSTDTRRELVAAGRDYIRRFSDEEFSGGMLNTYRKIIGM